MTVPFVYWIIGLAVLISCVALVKHKNKFAGEVLLVLATIFCASVILSSLQTIREQKLTGALIQSASAELILNVSTSIAATQNHATATTINVFNQRNQNPLLRLAEKALGEAIPKDHNIAVLERQQNELFYTAQTKLALAVKREPNNSLLRAELIIVKHTAGRDFENDLQYLNNEKENSAQELHQVLSTLYTKSSDTTSNLKQDIETRIPGGWYRDRVLLDYYKKFGTHNQFQKEKEQVFQSGLNRLLRWGLVFAVAALASLIGCIIIFMQLIFLPRKITPDNEKPLIAAPSAYGVKTIYSVFIAWLTTQLIVAFLARSFLWQDNIMQHGVLIASLVLTLIYALSNVPALAYIYYLALKPHGVKFREGLAWRIGRNNFSPRVLILAGVATWLAAIPIVIATHLVSLQFLGLGSSSNPAIAFGMEVALSQNLFAVVILYFAFGVLAPVVEETLFRGFLYRSLRRRFGVITSMFFSAGLFAAVHLDLGGFLPLFCLGCLFAFVFERTKSLLPSMIAHGLWNSAELTLLLTLLGH